MSGYAIIRLKLANVQGGDGYILDQETSAALDAAAGKKPVLAEFDAAGLGKVYLWFTWVFDENTSAYLTNINVLSSNDATSNLFVAYDIVKGKWRLYIQ